VSEPEVNRVVAIDLATSAQTVIRVGTTPGPIAVTPDSGQLWVVNIGSGDASRVDTATNRVTGALRLGSTPSGVAVTPDGSKVWFAVAGEWLFASSTFGEMGRAGDRGPTSATVLANGATGDKPDVCRVARQSPVSRTSGRRP